MFKIVTFHKMEINQRLLKGEPVFKMATDHP